MSDELQTKEPDPITDLADFPSLHALLKEEDTKKHLLQWMRENDVPYPSLIYRGLTFLTGRAERFLGGTINDRFHDWASRNAKLKKLLTVLGALQRKKLNSDALRTALRDSLQTQTPADLSAIDLHDDTSLEMLIALQQGQNADKILSTLDDQTATLITEWRGDLDRLFHDLTRPSLDWPKPPQTLGNFDRLKYNAGLDPLLGREDEIELLKSFTGDPSFGGRLFNFQWMLLTGEGGSGKTRLAYDFTLGLPERLWDAGKLSLPQPGFDALKWRPQKPTFIVIDYAQTHPEQVGDLLRAFTQNAAQYECPVRLLLLERRAEESWTQKMLPENSEKGAVLNHCFTGGLEGANLPPIAPEAIVKLMQTRFQESDGEGVESATPDPKALITAAFQVDQRAIKVQTDEGEGILPIPRPLFALAVAEEMIRRIKDLEDPTATMEREVVLSDIIKRERAMFWTPKEKDEGKRKRYEMLLALATLMQGFDLDLLDTPDSFASAAKWLPNTGPDLNEDILAAMGLRENTLPPLEPDILGEYFLLECFKQKGVSEQTRKDLLAAAALHSHPNTAITLFRILNDFPARWEELPYTELLAASSEQSTEHLAWLLPDVISRLGDHAKFNEIEHNFHSALTALDSYEKNSKIALSIAQSLNNVVFDAGKHEQWHIVETAFSRMSKLREHPTFRHHTEIAIEEAKAANNSIYDAGMARRWDIAASGFEKLDALLNDPAFVENAEILKEAARAAYNYADTASVHSDWPRIEFGFNCLEAMRRKYPTASRIEFAKQEAKAASNLIGRAGQARRWDWVSFAFQRIDDLSHSTPINDLAQLAPWIVSSAQNYFAAADRANDTARMREAKERVAVLFAEFGPEFVYGHHHGKPLTLGGLLSGIDAALPPP